MKTFAYSLIGLVLCVPVICARAQTSASPCSSSSTSDTKDDLAQQESRHRENSKDQSKKEKKNRNASSEDVLNSTSFSDAVAQALLQKVADGLEGYNDRLLLSAFNQNEM